LIAGNGLSKTSIPNFKIKPPKWRFFYALTKINCANYQQVTNCFIKIFFLIKKALTFVIAIQQQTLTNK